MTQNKRLIAITGGIGSGKSVVLSVLKKYGDVLSCDEINAEMLSDPDYLLILKKIFPVAFSPDFDKKKLSEIIFSSEKERAKLNAVAHPEIMRRLKKYVDQSKKELIFVEVPLLAGTDFEKFFSEIVVVNSDDKTRQKRIEERDGVDSRMAKLKMEAQKGDLSFPEAKVYSIDNSGSLADLEKGCDRLIENIIKK